MQVCCMLHYDICLIFLFYFFKYMYLASYNGTDHELLLVFVFFWVSICSVSDCCCINADGGGGRGIAGIVNDIGIFLCAMNGGWLPPESTLINWPWCWWLWWPWWPWCPLCWWWCGKDFGKTWCLLASVVRARRSLRAFNAIWRLRSISCTSTPGIVTTDVKDVEVELLNGTCGLMTPIFKKNWWIGLTRILIAGCSIFGKKLEVNCLLKMAGLSKIF